MQPSVPELRQLDRELTLARPIFLLLVFVGLFDGRPLGDATIFVVLAYLAVAGLVALLESSHRGRAVRLPVATDVAALAVFLFLLPAATTFWIFYLFVAYAAGIHWGRRLALGLAGAVTLGWLARTLLQPAGGVSPVLLFGLIAGTLAAGAGASFLGAHRRGHVAETELLARLADSIRVEHGLAESLRRVLSELAKVFACECAMVAFRDSELDRIFIWKARAGEIERLKSQELSLSQSSVYLLDDLDAQVCWNLRGPTGQAVGWSRRDARPLVEPPPAPQPLREAMRLTSLAAVSFDFEGEPAGRLLLCNARGGLSADDLRQLERVVRRINPLLDNLIVVRTLRARTIEAERARMARDIHDGVLQTLLSIEMQLDVFRRKLPHTPAEVAEGLASLETSVRRETEELRRWVNHLQPVHVRSADLVEMMEEYAQRFRAESGIGVDLLADDGSSGLRAPDRVCRELFQLFREALTNVKKHAQATHVVVKLSQDETKVVLQVDDNGKGFSFAGRFVSDELDRLRLGPISIKERTRGIRGELTIDSNPGHGARLTIEVPVD